MDKIIIVGFSGHAKVIIDIIEQEGRYRIAGFLHKHRKTGEQILGYQILGKDEDLPELMARHGLKGMIVAIGDNFIRSKVAARLREACPSLPFVSAIHPDASIAKDVSTDEGTVIMAGVRVNPSCQIGRFCILNTNSSLDHDSIMENFSSLAPHVTTGGNCRIGEYSAISIGSMLIQDVHVGEHTVIGAGSTVLKHVESFCVAYGTPARKARKRTAGEKYL